MVTASLIVSDAFAAGFSPSGWAYAGVAFLDLLLVQAWKGR